jgi:RNA polymerase sigma-70 factor (ECF subfamily)
MFQPDAEKRKETRKKGTLSPRKPSPVDVTEQEAIRRAQKGDPKAFEQLYHMHKGRVYSICLRMVHKPPEAEDLTQEAFLQLFRKIHTFRGESRFSTWLHRLSVNVVLMQLRKKKLPMVSLDETIETDEGGDGPKRDVGEKDLNLAGTLDRITLEESIAELPPGYRMVFLLHDVEGYEHNEIAEMMGCSIGNSKSQLHKARLRIRDLLARKKRKINAKQTK